MSMSAQKVFYALTNPLGCLYYARDLVRDAGENLNSGTNIPVYVLLPKHIDPSKFENLLLEDIEFFSGVNIQGISSFARNVFTAHGRFDLPARVDQIQLSEHFHNRMPRSLSRPLLNAVLELKNADFEPDYLKFLLEKRKDKEGAVLLEVFDEYQNFLKTKKVIDDADCKKLFIDEVLTPGSKLIDENATYIFAGFHEFTSFDIDIIKAVSSKAQNTFIVGPNIFDTQTEYSKLLKENFTSLGFKTTHVDNQKVFAGTAVYETTGTHEFSSINDEVCYVAKKLDAGTVYALTDVELYYSLLGYHLGGDTVGINASMRLDRTTRLTIISTLILLNASGWAYNDVVKILNFLPFWENSQDLLKFIDITSKQLTLPRGQKLWIGLAEEHNAKQVCDFFKKVAEKMPLKALPTDFQNAINLFGDEQTQDIELESINNLVARVVECLPQKPISAEQFVRKLYNHAEENYVLKGPISFKPLNVTLASLVAGNESKNVWFVGMNQEAFVEMAKEDVVMNDNFILAFRSEGFLYPSSKESAILASKIIKDAATHSNTSYLSSIGPVADILKDVPVTKYPKQAKQVLTGAITDITKSELELKQHKFPRLSASLITSYMECPYICMAQRILKAERQDPRDFELKPTDVGNLLHSAMEILLPKKLKGQDIKVEAEIEVLLNSKNFKTLALHPLKKVFIKYYADIVEKILDKEFEFLKERGLELFENPEATFEVKLDFTNDMTIKGKIDRIDVDKVNNKLYIADYKTATIPSGAKIKRGEDIQLATYIMAMASKYPSYDYDGYYISIKNLTHTELKLNSTDEAKQIISIYGFKAIEGIQNGIYTPAPMDPETCDTCSYRRCCGAV